MNDFDDRIGAALSDGPVAPAPPPFADVERRARRRTRNRRVLAGGAVLGSMAIVAGVLAAQQPGDEDGHTVVVTQPDESTTTTEPAPTTTEPTPTTSTTTASPTTTVPTPQRPDHVVVATADGRVLVLDVTSGDVVSDLGRVESADAVLVHDVHVSADGSSILLSVCCDGADVRLEVIPADGSALDDPGHDTIAEFYNVGIGPVARPWTAGESRGDIAVTSGPVASLAGAAADAIDPSGGATRGLAWSADGRRLAWQSPTTLSVADVVDEDDIRVVAAHTAPEGTYWSDPCFTYDGYVLALAGIVGEREGSPLDDLVRIDPGSGEVVGSVDLGTSARRLRCDPSGNWLMFVTEDHRLMLFEEDGAHVTIATGIVAADWARG